MIALAIWSFAPALRAYYAADDFLFMALSRLQQQPLSVFVHDHFPGSMYFRPLGLFCWWFVTAAAKASAPGQYLANLVLHLCDVGALYVLLQRLRPQRFANIFWAGVYAVHPLVVGTALWLADRFDLLNMLFSLLAVSAALAYAQRPRHATLGLVLSMLLLALMSKETGVVACAAAWIAIALAPQANLRPGRRGMALAAIAALTLGWLAYRAWMLSSAGIAAGEVPTLAKLFQGITRWVSVGAAYLFDDPRMPIWSRVLLAAAALLWLVALVLRALTSPLRAPFAWSAIGAVLVLILLPGPVQAPTALYSADVVAGSPQNLLIYFSRLYGLSVAGLVCLLMLMTSRFVAAPEREGSAGSWPMRLNLVAGFFLLLAFAPVSHSLAHGYASRTRDSIALKNAIESALAAVDIPEHGCRIYFFSVPGETHFSDHSDSFVKGLVGAPERIAHCLVQTERTPWAHFVRAGVLTPADWAPMQPLPRQGVPIPWIRSGNVDIIYLNLDAGIDARGDAQGLYFEYRDGRFVDISADVRAGRREAHFFNARPNQR